MPLVRWNVGVATSSRFLPLVGDKYWHSVQRYHRSGFAGHYFLSFGLAALGCSFRKAAPAVPQRYNLHLLSLGQAIKRFEPKKKI